MEVYVKIKMWEGLLEDISVLPKCPKIPNTSDEGWDNGYQVYVADLDLSEDPILCVEPMNYGPVTQEEDA